MAQSSLSPSAVIFPTGDGLAPEVRKEGQEIQQGRKLWVIGGVSGQRFWPEWPLTLWAVHALVLGGLGGYLGREGPPGLWAPSIDPPAASGR